MTLVTEEMKTALSNNKIFSVATASPDGEPNVVAISFVKLISDDEILVMDNFMGKTAKNLEANPRVAISCWPVDPHTNEMAAYQFKGDAQIVTSGEVFEDGCQWVRTRMPNGNPKAAVIVKVTEVYNLRPGAK